MLWIRFLKSLLQPLKRWLPPAWLAFYTEFRREYPHVDRSEVVLFAPPDILPAYTPRRDPSFESPATRCHVSLIATCLNEAANAGEWLDSLLQQTRLPDEVVIVDGGSSDDTLAILRQRAADFPIPMQVLAAPGSNIAGGRNLAFQHAAHSLVACTDFGCVLDRDWLRWLLLPFECDAEIVLSAGYYQPIETNRISRLAVRLFGIRLENENPQHFLPSGRSAAMTKALWEQAGGYPEWLTDAGEDTLFDWQAKAQPGRWAFAPQAIVRWRAPASLTKLIKTYYRYSRGDGQTAVAAQRHWWKAIEIARLAVRRAVLLALGVLASLVWPWGWLFWVVWFGVAGFVFLRANFQIASANGLGFFPYTLLLEALGLAQLLAFWRGVRERPQARARQSAYYRGQLAQILQYHPQRSGVIVYPPTHDWGFMFQRPHQMARAFARARYLFFFCTANERTDGVFGFRRAEPNLWLYHGPMDVFAELPEPLVYLGSAWNRQYLPFFDRPRVIYDHYDDLEVSGARFEDHVALLQQAEAALVTSRGLLESARKHRADLILAPNGVDYEFIRRQQPQPGEAAPTDWPTVTASQPVIGYSGALAQWFDYDLWAYSALSRPEWLFVLVGVDYDGSLGASQVLGLPNVRWLGMKPYTELFRYVWRFDVATIPFKVNAITLATSPIKLYEYMACGKPIAATPLPECRGFAGVVLSETPEAFVIALEEALQARSDVDLQGTMAAAARANTWDARAQAALAGLRRPATGSLTSGTGNPTG